MRLSATVRISWIALLLAALQSSALAQSPYNYFRKGAPADVSTKTESGFALMGGGKDQDVAFQWMCKKSGGGDFLILRARGDDAYNDYIASLCHQNSVATLVIPSHEAAMDPFVAKTIRNAEAVFIAGGDQANYVRNWQNTPVQDAINELIRRKVPVGGTSAGLAVLGEFSYSALNDGDAPGNLGSPETLANPYAKRVTITRNFLKVDLLRRTITDTHFVKRDRLGRLLGFMARIVQDKMSTKVNGIGVDERSVALLNEDGQVEVVGTGTGAYFFRPTRTPATCSPGKPLSYNDIEVYKIAPGATFNVKTWRSSDASPYLLNVVDGAIRPPAGNTTPYDSNSR